MNEYPKKIVSHCLEDPLDVTVQAKRCPRCDTQLEQAHHAATFTLPECWFWACTDCSYSEDPS